MKYKVATTITEVLDAWCVVYKQYLAASLISPNEFSLFTFPQYLSNNTAIITGTKMGCTVCTVSGVLDSANGLPLDNYYKPEIDELRAQGKKLIEIGLLADSRGSNSISSLTELMAGIARFGVYSNHLDYVIGVHPRRVNFFKSIFGANEIGDIKGYGKLNAAPVILLHVHGKDLEVLSLKINSEIYHDPKDYDFANRFQFNPKNFISDNEIRTSVDTFIEKLWRNNEFQPI